MAKKKSKSKGKMKKNKNKVVPKILKEEAFDDMYEELIEFKIEDLEKYVANGETNQLQVDTIVYTFNSKEFEPIRVGRLPNGKLVIIDGHHRTCAWETIHLESGNDGPATIRGYVQDVSSMAEVAAIYHRMNTNRRKKNQLELYKALLTARIPRYLKVDEVVNKHGFVMKQSSADDSISAIATILNLEKKYGLALVNMLLKVIRGAYDGHRDSTKVVMLNGLSYFLAYMHSDPYFDVRKFINKLRKATLNKAIESIKKTKTLSVEHNARTFFYATYVERVNQDKRPDPGRFTQPYTPPPAM